MENERMMTMSKAQDLDQIRRALPKIKKFSQDIGSLAFSMELFDTHEGLPVGADDDGVFDNCSACLRDVAEEIDALIEELNDTLTAHDEEDDDDDE
jgi:uncharacterized metal-binding protein YceD (DUF177 family)